MQSYLAECLVRINNNSINKMDEGESMEQDKMLELLEELKRNSQKKLMYQRISTVLILVFVLAVLALVPTAFSTLNSAKIALDHMDTAITEMETTLDSVEDLADDAGTAITNAETAITSAQTALEKIGEIDIETLNQAIKDLSDVVEPMSDFFGMFKR
jgi:septal ring factor EnvC (AmiA/AmiB activator)